MKLTHNTIFITGGGSGIGRALAEALHQRGNKVIIAGRRADYLSTVTAANPGMESVVLDVSDPQDIARVSAELIQRHPELNVLINNAGIMQFDNAASTVDEKMLVDTISTNLYGPIRVTSGLIEHLKTRPNAVIINVSSVLGFVPMAMTAVYSATKAAMHSYTLSQRYTLRDTSVRVLELAPPWVQTDLLDSSEEPRAMPLAEFIEETMALLATDADEILVARAKPLRAVPGPDEFAFVSQFNDSLNAG
ncbi:SDR family oxidoreductase [Pseudomonas arsenicoxydans]|uniref:SDR family NAD(P)-dependent oxidoreductase n=1 Tax=Pseudomonas arsenicoxydans TaxID=702115 RepID=A0A502HQ89_9PSED|nr:SDR family NAD(P)-dependent oxidoreductase [Pseudomonas arsenicoxydans]TPG75330.1 SDR family NAD(P)-dependent oxidoreductase [Pseudomonas arsenicoxydans]